MCQVVFRCGPLLSAGTASAFSRKPLCGVFRHVLGLGLRTARPIEDHCAYSPHRRPLFAQDKEGYGSFCIARRKWLCIFEESTVLRSKQASYRYSNDRNKIATPPAKKKHGDSLKKKTAFSACDDFQRSLPCPVETEA